MILIFTSLVLGVSGLNRVFFIMDLGDIFLLVHLQELKVKLKCPFSDWV